MINQLDSFLTWSPEAIVHGDEDDRLVDKEVRTKHEGGA